MGKGGPKYTPDQARGRIPIVAKRVAMAAVDLVISLETHKIDSAVIERKLWSLSGLTGYLNRLCHVVWKYEGLKRAAE
jgi:hypothetical protein